MRRDRIASVVTAVALVLAAVGGGLGPASVAQTATAEWSDECSFASSLIGAAYNTVIGADSGCRWIAGDTTDYENISATDAYSSSLSLKDSANSYTTTVGNFQENTRNIAYTKAKIEVVNGLDNGTTQSVVKNDANTTVRDYYSRQQLEVLKDWNAKVTQFEYLLENTPLNFRVERSDGYTNTTWNVQGNVTNGTYTLPNGTNATIKVIEYKDSSNYFRATAPLDYTRGDVSYPTRYPLGDTGVFFDGDATIQAKDPESSSWTNILTPSDYGTPITDTDSQQQQVVDNMDAYVDGVFTQYEAGELNATTLAQNDPALLASEATTSFNSTGYYGYASAQLASIGYSGDLNQSHVIEINGANYTGTLFYSGADGTTFETGKSYQFDNFSGSFYLAASDTPTNKTGIVRLDDKGSNFTILEATNTQTGESVNSTTTQKYVYETANASNLQQEIDRLEELRDFYEKQASAGGGVGINLGTEDKAIIGVIAAVVLVLALRD